MSDEEEKEKCPYCDKLYKNVSAHIKRNHPDKVDASETKKKSDKKSTDELEKSLAKKFLSKMGNDSEEEQEDNSKSSKLSVEDALKMNKDSKSSKGSDKGQKGPTWQKDVTVDYWLTNLHDAEVGVYQKERFMAKNRQFSKNLDLVGAVKDEGKADGMFGYNTEDWDNIPVNNLSKKRLVIKWFNNESVAWLGTLEEMVINSMVSSIGANDRLPSFKLILPNYDYVINLNKEHTRLKIGECYTFPLKNEKEDNWYVFSFVERRLTVGSDWNIVEGDDNIIGKIDEKVINIGGKFTISFYDEQWYKFQPLYKVVVLFAMMLKFNKQIQEKIETLETLLREKKIRLDISSEEEKFMMNPRAIKR